MGNVGVGKTMIIQNLLDGLSGDRGYMTINFSAQTSSNSLQDTIEGKLEKRTKGEVKGGGGGVEGGWRGLKGGWKNQTCPASLHLFLSTSFTNQLFTLSLFHTFARVLLSA